MWDREVETRRIVSFCLNTLFVRYGCGTDVIYLTNFNGERLNTLFVRYGCGTFRFDPGVEWFGVLIPYSSGMGVGR